MAHSISRFAKAIKFRLIVFLFLYRWKVILNRGIEVERPIKTQSNLKLENIYFIKLFKWPKCLWNWDQRCYFPVGKVQNEGFLSADIWPLQIFQSVRMVWQFNNKMNSWHLFVTHNSLSVNPNKIWRHNKRHHSRANYTRQILSVMIFVIEIHQGKFQDGVFNSWAPPVSISINVLSCSNSGALNTYND